VIVVLSREQMRDLDRCAIDAGVPGITLMENAGRNAAEVVLRDLGPGQHSAVIVCGSGNNGGDGYVVARLLLAAGHHVRVLSTVPPDHLRGDAAESCRAWLGLGGTCTVLESESDLWHFDVAVAGASTVVDALFGTGLDRDVEGFVALLIERINEAAVRRYSLDMPSGLDANTGRVLGVAVRADVTITFAHPKLGLYTTQGVDRCGRIEVADIGIPDGTWRTVGSAALMAERADVAAVVGVRPLSEYKTSAGHVLVVAGSPGKIGAALLVARAAARAGAGLVTLANVPAVTQVFDGRVVEAMTASIDPARIEESLDSIADRVDAIAIGPGLGLDDTARSIVEHVVLRMNKFIVVDADAVSLFAGCAHELSRARGRVVLTPHPGELGRLLGGSAAAIEADRFGAVARAVDTTGAVVLLKGPRTLIGAPGRHIIVNPAGSAVLATGGSGDVLTGVIAALGCKLAPVDAAFAAAYLHGRSGDRWAAKTGADRGMLAREIADGIPGALAELSSAPLPLTV
jgi:NAD(P)H-hydrate epimerase